MAKFKLAINGQEKECEATRQGQAVTVTIDGQTAVYQRQPGQGPALLFTRSDADGSRRHLHLACHKDGDQRQVWVNGHTVRVERVRERVSGSQDDASLAAAIPAVVTQILVEVGDTVAEGDKLILLESMKMVIPIQAPYAGQVTAVNCTSGESIQAGTQLIDLQPA